MPPVVVFGCGNFGSSAAVSLDLGARRSVSPAALPRNDRSVSTAGSNRSTVEKRCDTQAMVPKNGWLVLRNQTIRRVNWLPENGHWMDKKNPAQWPGL